MVAQSWHSEERCGGRQVSKLEANLIYTASSMLTSLHTLHSKTLTQSAKFVFL